jgi:lipopolysaccharide transport system ATP-binding protein
MSVTFREAATAQLKSLTAELPGGAIAGLIGGDAAAISDALSLVAGSMQPAGGVVEASEPRRALGPDDPFNLAPAGALTIHHTFSRHSELVRGRARLGLERLRRGGSTILVASNEQELLRELCDELWWFEEGQLRSKGDPGEVLAAYNHDVSQRLRAWAAGVQQSLTPAMRRGDGRAQLLGIELLDSAGQPTIVWQAGEEVAIRVTAGFQQAVDDPVVGIMIRTRIGFEVFGTNTELEALRLGPAAAGEKIAVTFAFQCELCPQDYTITAASHDPDGLWHDWMEDAIAFRVVDSRYTAGVANLRARVTATRV